MVELCVCVCVLFVWLSKGFVKGDTWSWPIEAQESEVKEFWFLETHKIRVNNYVEELETRFKIII